MGKLAGLPLATFMAKLWNPTSESGLGNIPSALKNPIVTIIISEPWSAWEASVDMATLTGVPFLLVFTTIGTRRGQFDIVCTGLRFHQADFHKMLYKCSEAHYLDTSWHIASEYILDLNCGMCLLCCGLWWIWTSVHEAIECFSLCWYKWCHASKIFYSTTCFFIKPIFIS